MEQDKSNVYFIEKPYFKEAMLLLAFNKRIDWLEDGMSLMSWEYRKVASISDIDPDSIYKKFKRWKGNKRAKLAGHKTISIGDIVEIGDNIRIATGYGWVKIPNIVWRKIKKN